MKIVFLFNHYYKMNITTNTFIEKIKINDNHYDYVSLKKLVDILI